MGADVQRFKKALIGANTELSGTPAGTYSNLAGVLSKRTYSALIANATAGTGVTESVLEHVRRDGIVRSITLIAPIAVAVDGTNNATITVSKRTAAGAAATIATIPTTAAGIGAGGFVAFVPFEVTAAQFTAANTQLAAGDVLTVAIAKGGSGVALTAATSFFTVSVDVEEN